MQRDDFISGVVRPDEPCPTGMRQIDPVAHKCTPAMQCMICDGYHLETKNEMLEIQKDREILQLADQVLPEIARGAEDLPAGKALFLAKCLAKWAHNKGCRP